MGDTIGRAQNWCLDPYGHHEARWFSRGIPTALVRDRDVESQDPPPDSAFAHRYTVHCSVVPATRSVDGTGPGERISARRLSPRPWTHTVRRRPPR